MRELVIARINDQYNDARRLGCELPLRSKITLDDKTDEELLNLYDQVNSAMSQKIGYDQAMISFKRRN
jgi:hypothetical protein